MAKNYMEEIAKMLGVELGERFEVEKYTAASEYYLCEDGLRDTKGAIRSGTLYLILSGDAEIIKKPWRPKDREPYWYACSDGDVNMIRKVYVCSPLRLPNPSENMMKVRAYCKHIATTEPGTLPLAPHIYFTQFLNDNVATDRALALDMDRLLVGECDELWVFGERVSDGMAAEITEAARMGIPIRWFTEDCIERAVIAEPEAMK